MSFHKIALSSISLLIVLAGTSTSANAQLYKWVDANGKVSYSDVPPPPNAKRLDTKVTNAGASGDVSDFPPELAAAVQKNPVTLYSSKNCNPCTTARNLLKSNGVPFSEKTVNSNDDIEKLKQETGDNSLPAATIGNKKLVGFNSSEWHSTLTNAGYPESSKLPADYRYPAAEPAAPIVDKPEAAPKKRVVTPKPEPESKIRF